MRLPRPLGAPRGRWFAGLVALGCVELGALLGLALGVRVAFDHVLAHEAAGPGGAGSVLPWGAWLAIGMALVLASALARGLQRPLGERFAQHYARRVRARVLRRWLQQPELLRARSGRGALLVRLLGDVGALSRWHGRVRARTVANLSALAAVGIALAVMAWPLALAALGPLLLGLVGQVVAGRRLESSTSTARHGRSRMAAGVARVLDGEAGEIPASPAVRRLDRRGRALGEGMVLAARDSGWIEALGLAMTGSALLATLAVGTALAADGLVTPGTVLLAALWVGQLSRPVHELARAQDTWRRARVSRRKLNQFLARRRPATAPASRAPAAAPPAADDRSSP